MRGLCLSVACIFMAAIMAMILGGCTEGTGAAGNGDTAGTTNATETTTAATEATTQEITNFEPVINGIPFGISPEELLVKLEELGIDLSFPDYDQNKDIYPENAIRDGRWYSNKWDYENQELLEDPEKMDFFYYYSNSYVDSDKNTIFTEPSFNIEVRYNYKGEFQYIEFFSSQQYSIVDGLHTGDSFEKMKDIYGENYEKSETSRYELCRYFNGEQYLLIGYYFDERTGLTNDTIGYCAISLRPEIYQ